MASLIYNSAIDEMARADIDFEVDTFKAMLVTSSYTPNKDTHDFRDDVTNEVANGNGYTTGGATSTVTVTKDTANDRVTIQFGAISWATSTITARGCVYYKSRGGADTADELVAYNDFGSDVSSSGGTFAVAASTITLQN
jgi:hypothetical protein